MARSESWQPLQAWVQYRVWVKPKRVHAQMPRTYLYENVLIIKIIIMTLWSKQLESCIWLACFCPPLRKLPDGDVPEKIKKPHAFRSVLPTQKWKTTVKLQGTPFPPISVHTLPNLLILQKTIWICSYWQVLLTPRWPLGFLDGFW